MRLMTGSSVHVALSHHVVQLVRISEVRGMNSSSLRPPLAVERSYRPSPWCSTASTSSGSRKRSKLIIHGSRECTVGSRAEKSRRARWKVSPIASGGTAGVRFAAIGHRFL